MPVHAHEIVVLVERVVEAALECPPDRGADPVRQMKVGRADHDPILAFLDADDRIDWTIALLAEPMLICDAHELRAVRPDETAGERDQPRGMIVVAAVAGLADRFGGIGGTRAPLPSAGAIDGAALRTQRGRHELARMLIGIDPASARGADPAPPLRRHRQWRPALRHEDFL